MRRVGARPPGDRSESAEDIFAALRGPTFHADNLRLRRAVRLMVVLDFHRAGRQTLPMKMILSTHNIRLTKAIEDHVLTRIDKLDHLDRWAIDVRVTLEHDHTRSPEKQFKCSMRLGVRGRDLFATDSENDLYAAIDLV
ncbi:MAG TPA: ribosome-associated translation inhibitor RaiA, partial [Verrucomicrobiales bacterium]|nr:ribosome-associated translation inhibitor RaiA [Verrucomicrobiales bacterium]